MTQQAWEMDGRSPTTYRAESIRSEGRPAAEKATAAGGGS
jgi:hypothetical protein